MCQVIFFYCCYWTPFRATDGKYLGVRFVSSISKASLVFFLLLFKNRADFCSIHNTQLLEGFFARIALSALVGVGFPVLFVQKRGQDTTRPSSVVVPDSCCWPVQVRRCQTVSSFALWKLAFCVLCRQFFPSFGDLLRRRLTLCLLR